MPSRGALRRTSGRRSTPRWSPTADAAGARRHPRAGDQPRDQDRRRGGAAPLRPELAGGAGDRGVRRAPPHRARGAVGARPGPARGDRRQRVADPGRRVLGHLQVARADPRSGALAAATAWSARHAGAAAGRTGGRTSRAGPTRPDRRYARLAAKRSTASSVLPSCSNERLHAPGCRGCWSASSISSTSRRDPAVRALRPTARPPIHRRAAARVTRDEARGDLRCRAHRGQPRLLAIPAQRPRVRRRCRRTSRR